MGLVRTNDKHYKNIAKAIRAKNGTSARYKPEDMPAAIAAIQGGEGAIGTYPVTVTPMNTEFTVYPDEGLAFSEVTVEGDENLIPENIAEGVSIYGVEGIFSGNLGDGLVLAMPEKYQEYVDYARENLYSGDYANLAIFDYNDWIAVSFLMDNFEITSYDSTTTEFTAIGWHTCGYTKSTGEWTYNDYTVEASTGWNYIGHIVFATCYIYYLGTLLYPVMQNDSSFQEYNTKRWIEVYSFDRSIRIVNGGYYHGKYVLCGYSNIYSSSDGVSWKKSSDFTTTLRQCIYANGVYVACDDKTVYTSNDLLTWVEKPIFTGSSYGDFYTLCYFNNTFMIGTHRNSHQVMYVSNDGYEWDTWPFAGPNYPVFVQFRNVVARWRHYLDGDSVMSYSYDCKHWTDIELPDGVNLSKYYYLNDYGLLVTGSLTSGGSVYVYTLDAKNWNVTTELDSETRCIFYGGLANGKWFMIRNGVMTMSHDGINFLDCSLPCSISAPFWGVGYINGVYATVVTTNQTNHKGAAIWSEDGLTWHMADSPEIETDYIWSVQTMGRFRDHGTGVLNFIDKSRALLYTDNGKEWVKTSIKPYFDFYYGDGKYIALDTDESGDGYCYYRILYSPAGTFR